MGADTRLCREPAFPGFALSAALRQLQAAEASELTAAIATGTGGLWRNTLPCAGCIQGTAGFNGCGRLSQHLVSDGVPFPSLPSCAPHHDS